jgi:hypothetical protein
VTTGIAKPDYARQFGAGGYVGRASGRRFDARRQPGYAPYDKLKFEVPVLEAGDVNARVWIRIREVEQSLSLIDQILDQLPDGELLTAIKPQGGPSEGLALAEAFRGDVLIWLRLDADARVERCHLRDASWFQWPLLESAIEGNIVADFPLCINRSIAPIPDTISRGRRCVERCLKASPMARLPSRRRSPTRLRSLSLRKACGARRVFVWAARSRSVMSMPALATVVSWKCMHLAMHSMTSNASGCASSLRPVMLTC